MTYVRTWIGIAFTAAVSGLVAFAVLPVDRAAAQPGAAGTPPQPAVGAVGCSGSACHGSPLRGDLPTSHWGTDVDRWKTSYEVWRHYDPHGRAYRVLTNEVSAKIEFLVAAGREPLKAWEDARCLACHSNPTLAAAWRDQPRHTEGVGCEACHGNATHYLHDHIGWGSGPHRRAKFRAAGMTELFDPAVRAETCAGCHVGAPGRDINHDLIAAGHPRLNFDYATYLRGLPPHWTEKDRTGEKATARPAGEIAHHWLVGRAATAAASCELLAARASDMAAPWPELSEFDCYTCHHNLRPAGFRDRVPNYSADRRPGSLFWNEPVFAKELTDLAGAAALKTSHAALRVRMSGGDRDAVAKAAKAAAADWRAAASAWANGPPMTPAQIATALQPAKVQRWDDAAHGYYALRALDAARGAADDPDLASLRDALRLPRPGHNSPIDFDPVKTPFDFRTWFGKRR
ncbi:MAG TPA: multiheme c-type cytochrome [Gemmata sp.]|nr:multiheme c-type cytochrome [Gemmata sp.]